MSYNANVPNAGQSPGLFPAQGSVNFTRLKTLFNAEHIFNDTAAADDGCHRQVTLPTRTDPVALPAGMNFIFYTAASFGKMYDGLSATFVPKLNVAVTFDGTGPVGAVTPQGTAINATVVKNTTGSYTITFPTPLLSTNGQFSIGVYNDTAVTGNALYACAVVTYTVTTMTIIVRDQNGDPRNPKKLTLMVMNS